MLPVDVLSVCVLPRCAPGCSYGLVMFGLVRFWGRDTFIHTRMYQTVSTVDYTAQAPTPMYTPHYRLGATLTPTSCQPVLYCQMETNTSPGEPDPRWLSGVGGKETLPTLARQSSTRRCFPHRCEVGRTVCRLTHSVCLGILTSFGVALRPLLRILQVGPQ